MGSGLFAATSTWTGAVSSLYEDGAGAWSNWTAPCGSNVTCYIKLSGANVTAGTGPTTGVDDWIAAAGVLYVSGTGTAPILNFNVGRQCYLNNGQLNVGSGGNNYGGTVNLNYGILDGFYNGSTNILNLNIAAQTGSFVNATGTMNFGNDTAPTGITMPSYLGGTAGAGGAVNVGQHAGENGTLLLHGYGTFTTYNTYGSSAGKVAYATTTFNASNGIGSIVIAGNGGIGTLSVTGGHLTIGTGALTLGANGGIAYLNVTIDASGISPITATTGISLGTGSFFNLALGSDFSATMGQSYTILSSANGVISGVFSNLADGGLYTANGYAFVANYGNNSSKTFTLTVTKVP